MGKKRVQIKWKSLKYIGERAEYIRLEINMVTCEIFYYVFFRKW